MNKRKDFFLNNKKLVSGILIHAGLMCASLVLAYNSYKEIVGKLPSGLKVDIKSTFPWAIAIFLVLFILYGIWRGKKHNYQPIWQYAIIFVLHASIVNLIFFFFSYRGIPILIVQNLALLYFATFLLLWGGMKKLVAIDATKWAEDVLPPILQRKMPGIREYCKVYIKEKPSVPFIICFMALLVICAFLLIFKQEKAAEQIANIAYFLLVIGVGIAVYQLIRTGDTNEEKEY